MKKKVLAYKHLPSRLPITLTLLAWLTLDRAHAPQWLWGAVGLGILATWVAAVYGMLHEEECEPNWK